MAAFGTPSLAHAFNSLLNEIDRVITEGADDSEKSVKIYKEGTKSLRCSRRANEKDVAKNMDEMTRILKRVEYQSKPAFILGPPKTKSKPTTKAIESRRRYTLPAKLNVSQLSLDISHTVMMTKRKEFSSTETAGTGRAIPLCLPNDCVWNKMNNSCKKNKDINRSTLEINPDAVKILESITGPVSVVAIVGPCRTGKSYILSRLISSTSSYEEPRFKLGHLMDPETMGIWMWDTPIHYQLKNGQYTTIILLDTEGIDAYNADKHGDTQIFTLSVLLSSLLIYNSTQVPRREDLDQMTFIANLAKSIGSRGSKQLDKKEVKQIAPEFLWLLRDAILEPVNSKGKPCHFRDYLIDKVLAVEDEDSFDSFSATDSVRAKASKCILEFFNSLDAEMIPPPSTNRHVMANIEDPRYKEEVSSEFLQQVEYVRQRILEKCTPKRGYAEGSLMNGIQFSGILSMYVSALNSPNGIPNVGSAWDQVMENTYATATNKAIELYKSRMSVLVFPMEENELMTKHRTALTESVGLFKELTHLDSDQNSYEKHLGKLTESIAKFSSHSSECIGGFFYSFSQQNHTASEKHCRDVIKSLHNTYLSPILATLSSNTDYNDIANAVKRIESEYNYQCKGPAREGVYNEFTKNFAEEERKLKAQLRTLKNYDEQLQTKQIEIAQEKARSRQEENEKRNLENKLHSERMMMQTLEEHMKNTEERMIKEAKEKARQHDQQMENMRQAKMKVEQEKMKVESSLAKTKHKLEINEARARATKASFLQQIETFKNNEEQLIEIIQELSSRPQVEKVITVYEKSGGGDCILQ